jgi:membrane AbrB-like protein
MENFKPVLLSMLLGIAGGAVFYALALPLPWVLGAMTANTIAAFAGVKIGLSLRLRETMICTLGMMLGSSFTPDIVDRIDTWSWAVVSMLVFVSLLIAVITFYYLRFSNFDRVTCFFSAAPGGLGPMAVIGENFGGDARMIPLAHAVRIIIVVFTIPAYLTFVEGLELPSRGAGMGGDGTLVSMTDLAILMALAAVGFFVAKSLKIPAASVVGPMVVCAAAYLFGLVEGFLPAPLTIAAQVAIGSSIGARFVGLRVRQLIKPITLSAISGLMMLGAAAGFSALLAPVLGVSRPALLLALAPGGLAEMSLIAFSLNIDTAFVATLHVARIMCIVLLLPFVFRQLGWSQAKHIEPRPG